MDITVEKIKNGLSGEFEIPADKSITHRAFMFSSLTGGKVKVKNFSKGQDCLSTLNIIEKLGCKINQIDEKTIEIDAQNAYKNIQNIELDCGNSGTTMRLMSGILAGQNFNSTLFGDESLSKRPMKRVITPLEQMGAKISHNDFKSPLNFEGTKLSAIDYISPLASAQVKSCVLLAGLFSDGVTTFKEPYKSRNHTELMLEYLGANIHVEENIVSIKNSQLIPKDIEIAGDISSAAFFIVAGLIVPNSRITIKNVGINPTRTGLLEVVKNMGGKFEVLNVRNFAGEDVADLEISTSELKGTTIEGEIIPKLIDELPVIAVLATQAEGKTVVKDAQDLRNKEADRIKCLVSQLTKMGIEIEETQDGFIIEGKQNIKGGCEVEVFHDHRLAMSFYISGLISEHPVLIKNFQWVNISFPEFLNIFSNIKNPCS